MAAKHAVAEKMVAPIRHAITLLENVSASHTWWVHSVIPVEKTIISPTPTRAVYPVTVTLEVLRAPSVIWLLVSVTANKE
jgi:hypothetical protein